MEIDIADRFLVQIIESQFERRYGCQFTLITISAMVARPRRIRLAFVFARLAEECHHVFLAEGRER